MIISAIFIVQIADVDNVNFAESTEETEYAASYLKTGIMRGVTYQMKLLTWVAWKLVSDASVSDWWLATEVRNARGFHDLVLKYIDNNVVANEGDVSNRRYLYRFVQIKHKMNLNISKISVRQLMSQTKVERQYSLIYLFKSYLMMLQKFEHITPDQIVDLIVFTNKDIGALKFLMPAERDDLFGFAARGKRYRMNLSMFKINSKILNCLREVMPNDVFIFDFLKKLVFAVDQPSESELEKLIIADMAKFYSLPQIFYNDLYKNIIEWFLIYNDGKAPYLTEKHVKEYLRNAHYMLLKAKDAETLLFTTSISKLMDNIKSLII